MSLGGQLEERRRAARSLFPRACHYTPSGGCVVVQLSSEPARVRLIVADTGIGIPPECVERVFDRFYRVDESRERESPRPLPPAACPASARASASMSLTMRAMRFDCLLITVSEPR